MRIVVAVAITCFLVLTWQYCLQAQLPFGIDKSKKAEESSVPYVTTTGRFQIFVSPNIKSATFMIDTDTGRVWIVKKDHTLGNYYLERISVEEVDKKTGSTKSEKTPSKGSKEKNDIVQDGKRTK